MGLVNFGLISKNRNRGMAILVIPLFSYVKGSCLSTTKLKVQQNRNLLLLRKPHGLPEHREGKLCQGLGIILVCQREPPGCPSEQRPDSFLICRESGDDRMLHEVPALLDSRRYRLIISMAGSYQQHSTERIPIRLIGVVRLFIVLRPFCMDLKIRGAENTFKHYS